MVTANELRIGNKLYYWQENNIVTVTPEHITVIANGNRSYNPIPLTAEILEKSGFIERQAKHSREFKLGHILIEVITTLGIVGINARLDYGGGLQNLLLTSLEFLHQLQNLYFALTGEELPIQL